MTKLFNRILFIDDNQNNILKAKNVSSKLGWHLNSLDRRESDLNSKIKEYDPDIIFLKDIEYQFSRYKLLINDEYFDKKVIILIVNFREEEILHQLTNFQNIEIISEPVREIQFELRVKSTLNLIQTRFKNENLLSELRTGLAGAESELLKAERLKTALSIVATYSHEINNPLTIALGNLNKLDAALGSENQFLLKIKNALNRITISVSNLNKIIREDNFDFESYSSDNSSFLLKSKNNSV